MPHRTTGHLNYLSNSNLDYNNAMNIRRIGAFAGIQHDMHGLAMQSNPLAGLAVNEMGGIVETAQSEVMEKPLLYAGLAMLAYAPAKNQLSKKKVSKKAQKQLNMAGIASIVAHYVMPMLKGE